MPHLKPGSPFFSIKSSFVRSGGASLSGKPWWRTKTSMRGRGHGLGVLIWDGPFLGRMGPKVTTSILLCTLAGEGALVARRTPWTLFLPLCPLFKLDSPNLWLPSSSPSPCGWWRWGQAGGKGHHGVSSSAQTVEKELTPLGEELGSKEQSQATGSALQSLKQS